MGDPRKQKNKFSTPRHPWEKARIDEEKALLRDYGLKNKQEIWRQASAIKKIKDRVKKLNISVSESAKAEKENLFNKLVGLNLLKPEQTVDNALELTTKDMLERRLQTRLFRKGLARTMKQSRQFIVHGHVKIGGVKVTAPSYVVNSKEELEMEFQENSNLADAEHPERKMPEAVEATEIKEEIKEEKTEAEEKEKVENLEKEIEKEVSQSIGKDNEKLEEEATKEEAK